MVTEKKLLEYRTIVTYLLPTVVMANGKNYNLHDGKPMNASMFRICNVLPLDCRYVEFNRDRRLGQLLYASQPRCSVKSDMSGPYDGTSQTPDTKARGREHTTLEYDPWRTISLHT